MPRGLVVLWEEASSGCQRRCTLLLAVHKAVTAAA